MEISREEHEIVVKSGLPYGVDFLLFSSSLQERVARRSHPSGKIRKDKYCKTS